MLHPVTRALTGSGLSLHGVSIHPLENKMDVVVQAYRVHDRYGIDLK